MSGNIPIEETLDHRETGGLVFAQKLPKKYIKLIDKKNRLKYIT